MPILLLSASLALTGCLLGGNGEVTRTLPGHVDESREYRAEGRNIFVSGKALTLRYCEGDTLRALDFPAWNDTLEYGLKGRSLTLFNPAYPADGGARIRLVESLTRVNGGNGLEGYWKHTAYAYEVVSGSLTEAEKAMFAGFDSAFRQADEYMVTHYRFADGKMEVFRDVDEARRWVDSWNGDFKLFDGTKSHADSADFNILARAIDKATVELKGIKSGETVRITMLGADGIEYSSDNPSHTKLAVTGYPASCPMEYIPDWYMPFLEANKKLPAGGLLAMAKSYLAGKKSDLGRWRRVGWTPKGGLTGIHLP